jgi:imidazolonepropionase-like amidohydrolase
MKLNLRLSTVGVAIAVAMAVGTSADAPHVYAIKGAKIVPVSGPAIASGTVVIRNGIIEAVGAWPMPPASTYR